MRSHAAHLALLPLQVCTSREKLFGMITFIDTPGLVDGSFQYPFPVEDAIVAVAKHVDLIYVFFDPIGQALCDRTMNVIQRLNVEHASRIRYFLSKADTVPNERDRQKVVVQITQNLSSKIRNAHAFELPSLYIPDMMPSGTKSSIENVLEHTCVEMEQTINQNVQNTLNKMEGDCKTITAKIDSLMAKDNEGRAANFTAMTRGFALLSLALALVAAGVVPLLHHFDAIPAELQPHLSGALALIPAAANGTAATEAPAVRIGGGAFAAAFVLYVLSLFVRRYVFAAILDKGAPRTHRQ